MKNILVGIGITLVVVSIVVVILVLTGVIKSHKSSWTEQQKNEIIDLLVRYDHDGTFQAFPRLLDCAINNASIHYSYNEMKQEMENLIANRSDPGKSDDMHPSMVLNLFSTCFGTTGNWSTDSGRFLKEIIREKIAQIKGTDCADCTVNKIEQTFDPYLIFTRLDELHFDTIYSECPSCPQTQ